MIVGEAPGEQEERAGVPFVGSSGGELDRMLQEAGILRSTCFVTNVIRKRPPGNDPDVFFAQRKSDITLQHINFNGKHCLPVVMEGIELLKREIEMCQPNVIIALGNTPLWALTGNWGITSWRGSELQCTLPLALDYKPKVIPTYHPSLILRQWAWRQTAVHDLRRARMRSSTKEFIPQDYDFLIRGDYSQVLGILDSLIQEADKGPLWLAQDIETRAGHIACYGIAWSKTAAMCIPFMRTDEVRPVRDEQGFIQLDAKGNPVTERISHAEGYWSLEEETQIVHRLWKLTTHANVFGIGQNFPYDAQYTFRHWGFIPRLQHDTMLSHHSMFANSRKSLDYLSSMYCEQHVYWKDDGKLWDPSMSEDQLWRYNCVDAVRTFEVAQGELAAIKSLTPTWPKLPSVHAFQQRLFYPVLETMNRGIRCDTTNRGKFALDLQDEIAKREQFFIDLLGEPVNPKSPKQMQELFYGTFGQKPIFNRKTGTVTCDDEALTKLGTREPLLRPLIRRILEHRSLGVFLSTFVNAPLDQDGRIRCSFNIAGTETYRFSSSQNAFGSGLNLQNIPSGGEDGDDLELPNIRKLFLPDPGHTFFDIDLSSADLRIVTWESDCKEMKEMLREGKNPYVEVAKEYYRDPSITKKHPRYRDFKSLAHGTHYLGSAQGLSDRIGLAVHEVDIVQKWYFGKFPEIKRWQDDFKDQVTKRRFVENIFGHRCYVFDRIQGTIFNQMIAWLPQSTVARIINEIYCNIYDNLKEVQILLQVHDSLAGQFPSMERERMLRRIVEEAEKVVLPYADPLVIPVGVKYSDKSWGDCE
jgi:DNA polymerase I-like protein with 3'-5' exonuclease and polymerase domains/uracil-DNA glycosylase